MKERNDTNAAARTDTGGEPPVSEFVEKAGLSARLHNVLRIYIERWGDVKLNEIEQGKFLLLPNCGSKTWHDFEFERDKYGYEVDLVGDIEVEFTNNGKIRKVSN